jgi:outer membrane cobalamin receptor
LPNPALASESALTADAGARYASKPHGFRIGIEIDGFATHADDLITLLPEGAFGLLKAANIASARIFGVESSVDVRGHGLDLRAAYTGLLTYNDDPTAVVLPGSPRPPLPGRPGNDFVGDIAYTLGPVRARYGVDYVGSLYADERGTVPVPDRLLQSAGLRVVVPWVPSLRFAADISNLFDVRTGIAPSVPGQLNIGPTTLPIGDQFDYPLPGRTFLVTARWSVGAEEPR